MDIRIDFGPFREYYKGVAVIAIFVWGRHPFIAYIRHFPILISSNPISTYLDNQTPSGDLKKYTLPSSRTSAVPLQRDKTKVAEVSLLGLHTTFFKKGQFVLCALLLVGFLLGTPVFAHAGILGDLLQMLTKKSDVSPQESSAAAITMPLMGSGPMTPSIEAVGGPDGLIDDTPLPVVQDSALVATRNPQGTLSPYRDQIVVYTVQDGDTPGGIAKNFGISLNTLLWANNITDAARIKPGDQLVVLPVSGVKYQVRKGDTIESIAKKFNGDISEIVSFNDLVVGESLDVGSTLIIPDGEMSAPVASPTTIPKSYASRFASLPDFAGYYIRPISGGRKTRGIHGFNGVDLAESCGLPVSASANGTVIIARDSGWNGGYGKYIVIAHPNGTQTLYAHLSAIFASAGQQVVQGVQIANVGTTGNSTGCHVHFEVRGAKNPF